MATLRKRIADLSDMEMVLFRALCNEMDSIQADISSEAQSDRPNFSVIATAQRDRRLIVEWLRDQLFPPASTCCSAFSNADEERLLTEPQA